MTWAPAAGWSGHNDVYFRATDGSMQHSWTLDGGATWSGLESQGPWLQTGSSPSCVSSGVGNVLCAVQGGDNAIYVKTYASATGWSGYRAISPAGTTTSPMSVTVPPGGGTVRAFYRGNDGALWFYTSADNAATWTGPTTLGGGIVGAPGCVAWEQDRVDCVVQGGGATLYYTYFDQNQWFGFAPVAGTAGTVLSAPTLASWQNGRLDALWTGPGNVLEHVWSTGNANGGATWSAVESLGAMAGGIAYAPSCVSKYSAGAYRLDCYATGLADGNIHHKWYDLSTPMAGCNVDSDCGGGARCVYGTCGCNAAYACSSGCCATTPGSRAVAACNAGASNAACGGTGAICQACASGTTCQASACTAPPPPPPFDCDSCACGCNANANACAPPVRCNATACRKSGGYCDPCGGCSM